MRHALLTAVGGERIMQHSVVYIVALHVHHNVVRMRKLTWDLDHVHLSLRRARKDVIEWKNSAHPIYENDGLNQFN